MGIWRIEVSLGDRHLYVVSNSMFVLHECFELFCINTVVFILCQLCIPSTVRCQVLGRKLLVSTICGGGIEICLCSPLYIFGELLRRSNWNWCNVCSFNVQVSLKTISLFIYRSTVPHTCMEIIHMTHHLTHLRIHVRRLKVIYYILPNPYLIMKLFTFHRGIIFRYWRGLAQLAPQGKTRSTWSLLTFFPTYWLLLVCFPQYPFDYAASEFGISSQWNPTKLFLDILAAVGLVWGRKRGTAVWELRKARRPREKERRGCKLHTLTRMVERHK